MVLTEPGGPKLRRRSPSLLGPRARGGRSFLRFQALNRRRRGHAGDERAPGGSLVEFRRVPIPCKHGVFSGVASVRMGCYVAGGRNDPSGNPGGGVRAAVPQGPPHRPPEWRQRVGCETGESRISAQPIGCSLWAAGDGAPSPCPSRWRCGAALSVRCPVPLCGGAPSRCPVALLWRAARSFV